MEQKKSPTFFDIISDIEGDAAPLDEVIAALILFGEQLQSSVNWLDTSKPYTVEMFTHRFGQLALILNMILRELERNTGAIHASITQAYSLQAEQKANAATL